MLWTTEICSLQDNLRPFPLSRCTSPSTKSPIAILRHLCVQAACLQLSAQAKCGSQHGQLEREHMHAVGFWISLKECLVFVSQHIILTPNGTSFDMHFHTHCVLLHDLDYKQLFGFLLQCHSTVQLFHEEQCSCLVMLGQHSIICALQLLITSSHDATLTPSAGKCKKSDSNWLAAQRHKIASRLLSVWMLEHVLLCHLLKNVWTTWTTTTKRSGKGSRMQWTTWQRAATHNWAFWFPFEQDNYGLCSTNIQSTTPLILTACLS